MERDYRPHVLGSPVGSLQVDGQSLLSTCHAAVDAVGDALDGVEDWSLPGERAGQYGIDLVADAAALEVLESAGLGVLSEESGRHRPDAELVAVIDPVDGSTNASRHIPWYACSICVVDSTGPLVAVVANLPAGTRYEAVRGRGARLDGAPLRPSGCERLGSALIALSGYPRRHLGWSQFRAFGAAALDLCAVAEGKLDAFTTGTTSSISPWDYMGALLVCNEAGAVVADLHGQPLVTFDHSARRSIAAGATQELLDQLVAAHSNAATPGSVAGATNGGGGGDRAQGAARGGTG